MNFFDSIFGTTPKRKPRRKKNGVARGKNWRSLEKRGRRTSHFKGYKITTQKYSKSTKTRPDFTGYSKKNPRDRIVGDAKDVDKLQYSHVDKVIKYKGHPNYAKTGVLIVAKRTKIPPEVREYAKKSNVKITRMSTMSRKKKKGFLEW
jgi:hypothetical protein